MNLVIETAGGALAAAETVVFLVTAVHKTTCILEHYIISDKKKNVIATCSCFFNKVKRHKQISVWDTLITDYV